MTGLSRSSIYELQQDALADAAPDLFTGLHDLSANVTDANEELYNATDDLRNASGDVYDLRANVTASGGTSTHPSSKG